MQLLLELVLMVGMLLMLESLLMVANHGIYYNQAESEMHCGGGVGGRHLHIGCNTVWRSDWALAAIGGPWAVPGELTQAVDRIRGLRSLGGCDLHVPVGRRSMSSTYL